MFYTYVIIDTKKMPYYKCMYYFFLGSSGLKQKERFIDLLGEDAYISHIKFIFPTAPSGYLDYLNKVTTIWYNVTNSKLPNLTEARTSINYIHSLYQAEVARGIDPSRIVIGGFSQGGCLAMGIGFTRTKKVRGIAVVGSIYDSSFQQVIFVLKKSFKEKSAEC
uniref:palmitoyl-protein hydrolase n=1 Tax=Rhodnius prolixus TaxID=13249 RepID=T1HPZ9_RHOPR